MRNPFVPRYLRAGRLIAEAERAGSMSPCSGDAVRCREHGWEWCAWIDGVPQACGVRSVWADSTKTLPRGRIAAKGEIGVIRAATGQ